MIRRWKRNSY